MFNGYSSGARFIEGDQLSGDRRSAVPGPGFIYVLASPNCASVKIGRTAQPPPLRLREINASPVYRECGPWGMVEVAQVTDMVAVETRIHRSISSRRNTAVPGQKELFDVSIAEACKLIRETPTRAELLAYPKLERCFFDERLAGCLDTLYELSGLSNFTNDQGAWTLSLFTKTSGGRYFTLNIGPHEVAYATRPRHGASVHENFLMVDRLILDFPEVRTWVRQHGGQVSAVDYKTQRDRATGISYFGDFATALKALALPGVRRSLIAYWTEGLLELREGGRQSPYKRWHQWNAVAELQRRAEGLPRLFGPGAQPR